MQWSRGGCEFLTSCPACGTPVEVGKNKIFIRHDDESKMPDKWKMHLCRACGSIYLNPRPDGASLPNAYIDYLTHGDQNIYKEISEKNGFMWNLIRLYLHKRFGVDYGRTYNPLYLIFLFFPPLRQKLDRFGRNLTIKDFKNRGRLLDVGAGNGSFLDFAEKMGWIAEGVEPDPVAADLCKRKGLNVRHGFIDAMSDRNGQYDVLTMNHVIEHVPDIGHVLLRSFDLLKPGGVLWIALPNPQSLGRKLFGASFCALHPPFHLCIYSQKTLKSNLRNSGFVDVKIIRRGFHAKAHWRDSVKVSSLQNISVPSKPVQFFIRWFADLLSIVTPRWSEETVIVARRSLIQF